MAYMYSLKDLANWPTKLPGQINSGLQARGMAPLPPDQGPPQNFIQGGPSPFSGFQGQGAPAPTSWADVAGLGQQVRQRYGITDEMANQFRPGAGVTPQDVYTSLQSLLMQPQQGGGDDNTIQPISTAQPMPQQQPSQSPMRRPWRRRMPIR